MTPMSDKPRYILRPVTPPAPSPAPQRGERAEGDSRTREADPFLRPPAEDDDGYDPFSDRPPAPEPTFQEDPWR